jgi:hypothetical protein
VVRSRHRHLRGKGRAAGRSGCRGDGVDLRRPVNPVPPPDGDRHPGSGRLPRPGPARLARPLSRHGAAPGSRSHGVGTRAGRSYRGGRGLGGTCTCRRYDTSTSTSTGSDTGTRRPQPCHRWDRFPTVSAGGLGATATSPSACPRQSCLECCPRRPCANHPCANHPCGPFIRATRTAGTSAAHALFRGGGVRTPAIRRTAAPRPRGSAFGDSRLGGSRTGGRRDGMGRRAVG